MSKLLSSSLPFAVVAAGAFTIGGCVVEREYTDSIDEQDRFASADFQDASDLGIRNGRVRGDIGAVRGFDAAAEEVDAYSDGYYTSVNLTAYDSQNRMGMIILDADGVDLRAVRPGTYTGADGMYVTGCSAEFGQDFDAPGEDVEVVVADLENGDRQVTVNTSLPTDTGDETTAVGTFIIGR